MKTIVLKLIDSLLILIEAVAFCIGFSVIAVMTIVMELFKYCFWKVYTVLRVVGVNNV